MRCSCREPKKGEGTRSASSILESVIAAVAMELSSNQIKHPYQVCGERRSASLLARSDPEATGSDVFIALDASPVQRDVRTSSATSRAHSAAVPATSRNFKDAFDRLHGARSRSFKKR